MSLKPEMGDYIQRASTALYAVMGVCGGAVQNLAAIQRLADDATDDTAKSVIEKARVQIKEALSAFLATDFDTADLDAIAIEVLPGVDLKPG